MKATIRINKLEIEITVEKAQPEPLEYVARKEGDSWTVVDGRGVYLYLADSGHMTRQEARDLAWAYNNGAEDDDEAIKMIIERRGGKPPHWLPKCVHHLYVPQG